MARAESAVHLQPATSNPLGEIALRAALGQLGNNSLALTHLDLSRLNLTQGKPSQPHLSIDLITRFTDHEPSFCMQCCTLCNAAALHHHPARNKTRLRNAQSVSHLQFALANNPEASDA